MESSQCLRIVGSGDTRLLLLCRLQISHRHLEYISFLKLRVLVRLQQIKSIGLTDHSIVHPQMLILKRVIRLSIGFIDFSIDRCWLKEALALEGLEPSPEKLESERYVDTGRTLHYLQLAGRMAKDKDPSPFAVTVKEAKSLRIRTRVKRDRP